MRVVLSFSSAVCFIKFMPMYIIMFSLLEKNINLQCNIYDKVTNCLIFDYDFISVFVFYYFNGSKALYATNKVFETASIILRLLYKIKIHFCSISAIHLSNSKRKISIFNINVFIFDYGKFYSALYFRKRRISDIRICFCMCKNTRKPLFP